MDTELLDNVSNMKESPYSQQEKLYSVSPYSFDNEHIMEPYSRPIRSLGPHPSYSKDPDYLSFLDFKKNKERERRESREKRERLEDRENENSINKGEMTLTSSNEDQFNELLLYMFTGFFLLVLYDSIYKLGRDAY